MRLKRTSFIGVLHGFNVEDKTPKIVDARHMGRQFYMLEFGAGVWVLEQLAIMLIYDGFDVGIGSNRLFAWHGTKNGKSIHFETDRCLCCG
jgi:hypothetical protein